ncbi:MAG: hypothetical protein ACPGRX_05975 [Bdellovibrionales bacterium]
MKHTALKINLFCLAALALWAAPVMADPAYVPEYKSSPYAALEHQKLLQDRQEADAGQNGIALPMDEREFPNGELSLFFKDGQSENAIRDITDNDLNRIEPAVGVQLKFDFGL